MLPRLGDEAILERKTLVGFIFEPKFYGVRVFVYKDGDDIEMFNTKGEDILYRYPEFIEITNNINARSCVLDATIVVFNKDKKPDPRLLQKREQTRAREKINEKSHIYPATLFAFDILELEHQPIINKPLRDRKIELHKIIVNSDFISAMPWTANAKAMWRQVEEQELEGMMAKEGNSKYEQESRSWYWLKVKRVNTINVAVIGYIKSKEVKDPFDSLVLALYHPNKIWPLYAGTINIASDFDKITLRLINKVIKKVVIEKPTLLEEDQARIKNEFGKVVWLRTEIILKVKYDEITPEFIIKNSSFISLRFDKKLENCMIENI